MKRSRIDVNNEKFHSWLCVPLSLDLSLVARFFHLLVVLPSSFPFFFTKELPRISGRRLVSNSFINPLALFRISFSPSSPSFSFFLLYLFLSLSLYLRHPKQLSTIRIPFISFGTIIQFRKSKIRKLKFSRLVRGSFIQTSSRNKGD